jgi:hypothetical protein
MAGGAGRLAAADTLGRASLVNHLAASGLLVCRVAHGYSKLRI